MRKVRLCIVILFFISAWAGAQSFEVVVHDSILTGSPGETFDLKADIINPADQVLALAVIRAIENTPENWSTSLCLGETCYPSVTDSVTSAVLEKDTLEFKITFNTSDVSGEGRALVRFRDMVTNDIVEVEFKVETLIPATFELAVHDSVLTGSTGKSFDMKIDVINLHDIPMAIEIKRVQEAVPEGWNTAMCLGSTCYPSVTDSITGLIAENDTAEFKLTFNTDDTPGEGEATILFHDMGSGYMKDLTCRLQASTPQQRFEIHLLDSTMNAETGSSFDLAADVVNLSGENVDISIVRMLNEIPKDWSTSLCVGETCFPTFTDSVAETIAPTDTMHFKLTFNTDSIPGNGDVSVVFTELGTSFSDTISFSASTQSTSLRDPVQIVWDGFELIGNYPNPFNPVTVIRYAVGASVRADGNTPLSPQPYSQHSETHDNASLQDISLTIHNVLGEKIATLVSEQQPAGVYEVRWDASAFASGIYYYRLKSGSAAKTKRMILIR